MEQGAAADAAAKDKERRDVNWIDGLTLAAHRSVALSKVFLG